MGNGLDARMEQSLSSLLFFYFGFDLDDLKDKGFDPLDDLVDRAYSDATNQGAFNTLVKGRETATAKKDGAELLKEEIPNLQDRIGDLGSFDEWHTGTCNELVKSYERHGFSGLFTFGNAQKWVNMTLKYADMLIPIYSEFVEKVDGKIKMPTWMSMVEEYHNSLHAPMDSYIIEAVWEGLEDKKEESLPLKGKLLKNGTWGKYSSEKVKGWSSWEEKEYKQFHDALGSIIEEPPIEWEAKEWIRIAKQRKKRPKE